MNTFRKRLMLGVVLGVLGLMFLLWPQIAVIVGDTHDTSALAQTGACQLSDPKNLTGAVKIDFDTLADGTVIGDAYRPSFGVRFDNDPAFAQALINANPASALSDPNVAINKAIAPQAITPMTITFDVPKSQVGFYIGNGSGQDMAYVTAYDAFGNVVCQAVRIPVPAAHTTFVGVSSIDSVIARVTLNYLDSNSAESIDDLYFSPASGLLPTRTPAPTWTSVPTLAPTAGPAPTATPVVPVFAYQPQIFVKPYIFSLLPDFAIHGIEITQGIQCFDTSKGLTTCANNSVPVVAKKDTTARIYLKASNLWSVANNVPVRLHIFANNVEYIANTSAKTTTAIDQSKHDSGDIYFNVNFSSAVDVSFYAEVDPNNVYTEVNESNNRFPASGTITLNFKPSKTMTIVGQRLRYHPSGYGGTQYAGGWAVNGGAADWFEQLLPIRNNGITYNIASGYLNWTTSLGSGDGQHALIQNLNAQWMLQNLFSWWFSGPYTGARHVYSWAPSAGYSGGHADMPIYPHAGGLGKVGIGSDAAGTSTDNPGSGALIFGHELTHDYNIYHTNTADSCGSNDSNSNFPYSSSSIQEFGFNPLTGKIYDPALTHDLMSYCPAGGSKQGWISPFIWTTMAGNLAAPAAALPTFAPGEAPNYTLHLTAAGESLQVNASIFNPLYKPQIPAQLGNLFKTQGGIADYPSAPNSPYAIQLRDGANNVLASYPFDVNFESEYDAHGGPDHPQGAEPNTAPPFPPDPTLQIDVSFIIPWDPQTASVVLVLNDQVLDSTPLSPNAPQVLITAPTGAEAWAAGSSHTLTWQAIDLDGDPLIYAVFYSYDAGATWSLLASDLGIASLDIDADAMAGGSDVRFRVVATDGLNTGFDETDEAISIPNKLPTASILTPDNNTLFQPGALVVLQGIGVDMEDGTLPDEALHWSSNVQGSLGDGPSVPLNALQPGKHIITLTATDSLGASSVAETTIFIGYRVYLPQLAK